ncbi:MAG TPA: dephospho-CoA kinase [Acidimicrobiales bacterium]|nr:dephospho-CoA kinase [Acidimicrobiales bacterium]
MIAVGCTGGIGSGKSSLVGLLAQRGAVVVDADALARHALDPGEPSYGAVVGRFGTAVLSPDGSVDRTELARRVFGDAAERAALEAIVHPVVSAAIAAELDARRGSDAVVVVELPLLVETGGREAYGLDAVIVVDAPADLAVERLVRRRGLEAADARRRVAAQADAASRIRAADFVVVNVGTLDELALMAEEAWRFVERLRAERAG